MNGTRSPSPTSGGRSLDIELSGQEIITVDLDNLDANPDDLLEVLRESQSKVFVWTKLATEYWRRGNLEAAEKLALGALECMYCRWL
jgi:RNA polymerase-associated protein CTR9